MNYLICDVEYWKPIPGYPDYEASSLGRIKRVTPANGTRVGYIGKYSKISGGYYAKRLTRPRQKSRLETVHTIIAHTFHGPRPEGMVCRHLNGDPYDNRASNLRWGTRQENAKDALMHSAIPKNKPYREPEKVLELYKQGHAMADIGAFYGVTTRRMGMIIKELRKLFGVPARPVTANKQKRWADIQRALKDC